MLAVSTSGRQKNRPVQYFCVQVREQRGACGDQRAGPGGQGPRHQRHQHPALPQLRDIQGRVPDGPRIDIYIFHFNHFDMEI